MPREIVSRAGVGTAACLRQRSEMLLASLVIGYPTLILVKRGTKRLRAPGVDVVLRDGEAVAVAAGQAFDVLNTPTPDGWYEAAWIVFQPELFEQTAVEAPEVPPIRDLLPIQPMAAAFAEACDRAMEGVLHPDRIPEAIAVQRAREVLVWIAEHGGRLTARRAPSLAADLRDLIASAPDRDWTAGDVSARFAMSEATLRRRLAAEKQSLSRILIDVRMSLALSLLQATDRPVIQIAYDVGYDSPSRFAARFRDRFGYPPTAVRGEDVAFDRFGTANERHGGAPLSVG